MSDEYRSGRTIRVDDATYERLRRLADADDRPLSRELRRAVEHYEQRNIETPGEERR